jgi:hypothetical protein
MGPWYAPEPITRAQAAIASSPDACAQICASPAEACAAGAPAAKTATTATIKSPAAAGKRKAFRRNRDALEAGDCPNRLVAAGAQKVQTAVADIATAGRPASFPQPKHQEWHFGL